MSRVYLAPPSIIPAGGQGSTVNDVRIASPVMGYSQWRRWGSAVNWLQGYGGQLIVNGPIGGTLSAGTTTDFRWYTWPSSIHTARLWNIGLRGTGAWGYVDFDSGAQLDFVLDDANVTRTLSFVDIASSPATGEETLGIIVASGSGSVVVDSVLCTELPRAVLSSTANTRGMLTSSLQNGELIYDPADTLSKLSAGGLWAQVQDAKDECRRKKLFDWCTDDATGLTITDTTFTGTSNILAIDPPVQTRHMENGTTVREIAVAVYSACTGGPQTADFKVSAASGDSVTFTINGAAQWHTNGVFDVETDDFTQPSTIRGGTSSRDTLTFEARVTGGTTNVKIYAICVAEA